MHSELLRVQVTGRPMPATSPQEKSAMSLQHATSTENAELSMTFCADPPPRAVRWEWGSMVLLEGEVHGRIASMPLESVGQVKTNTTHITKQLSKVQLKNDI